MGFLDGFLNKMNFSTTDEYDGDYDDMDMTEETKDRVCTSFFYSNLPQEVSKKYLKQGGFYEWCYETVRSMYDHSKGVQRY